MKNKLQLLLFLILSGSFSFSQKQGNIWYFPQNAGLDFTTGTPVPISTGQTMNSEGCATICDSTGNLLFYATPTTIWNHKHAIMPHGSGLMGGNSSTQGVFIIPEPGSNELFYVFTLDEFQNNLTKGLRYSIVNMCLDSQDGDVDTTTKNTLLLSGAGEKMAATFHANGTDIWLVTRKHFTNEFYSFLISSAGISAPVISAIGWANPQQIVANSIGQMKISPDGSKIAFAVGNQVPNVVQLFDFNKSNGVISNLVDLPTSTNSGSPYGISFSPDNSKLYVWGPTPTGLNQFDLSSGIPDTIKNSLFHVSWNGPYGGTGMQLANNGKIYIAQPSSSVGIGVINSPNLKGNACNFVGNAIACNSFYSLPGFIDNFNYKNGVPFCTIHTGIEESIESMIHISPCPGDGTFQIASDLQQISIREIRNVMGQQIPFQINSTVPLTIVISNQPGGVYFIKLETDQGHITKKTLIQN